MHAETFHRRSSAQTRPAFPMPGEDLHPRAAEMAETMRDLFAAGGGVMFKDLLREGFSPAEIAEHHDAARSRANALYQKQVTPRPDFLPEVIEKARSPRPDAPPLPRRTRETQALLVAWSHYCAAREALTVDPWLSQRERCLDLLRKALNQCDMLDPQRDEVVKLARRFLPLVPQ